MLVIFAPFGGKAQAPDSLMASNNQIDLINGRIYLVASTQVVGFTGALIALDQAWYKDFPRSAFHFHNDMPDWLQQDKLGHMVAAYQFGRISFGMYQWAGIENRQSAWLGAVSGTAFLTAIEVLDGFSAQWGASVADAVANTLGTALFLTQQITWEQQKMVLKYSFSASGLAKYRPHLLGNSLPEQMLKDYNGQTFWLSLNLHSAIPGSSLPKWLNLAVGHGASGMLGSRNNPDFFNGIELPQIQRYRRWYLAPDIDFTRIHTQNPWLKALLSGLNIFKMPAPALEYNSIDGFRLHWLFF